VSQDILQSIRDLSVELASAIHDNNLQAAQPVVDKLDMLADTLQAPAQAEAAPAQAEAAPSDTHF
jgi:hypothetical protein